VSACLDPSARGRGVGRSCLVLLGAGLLLGLSCAPRPVHREVEPAPVDAGDEGGSSGTATGGASATGGSGTGGAMAEPMDASSDAPITADLAVDSPPPADLARDLGAPEAHDAGGPDLPPGVDLTTGLIHHWKFDEGTGVSTADATGHANNGKLSGGGLPDWTAGGAPIPGNTFSLTFDGVDDYVALDKNLAPVLGGTATLSCWLKTTQKGANNSFDAPGITGVEMGGGSNDIFWGFLDADGYIGLRPGSGRTVKSATAINDNLWHNVVMTRDQASGQIQIFVDGKLAKGDDGMQMGAKTTPFSSLGRITDSSKPYFKGQLDDVRIWDRVLSPAEVAAVFAGN
jgi:hypothetical protein